MKRIAVIQEPVARKESDALIYPALFSFNARCLLMLS